jgi:hypothetical protein
VRQGVIQRHLTPIALKQRSNDERPAKAASGSLPEAAAATPARIDLF